MESRLITYSFIIPHHNNPVLLNRCLSSIPQRDDIQIVVVDDNSMEDKKPNICREGVDVLYIDSAHTKGAGHARNVGLSKAIGKWLLFADCDDCFADRFLDVLDKYKDEDLDVVYYNFFVLDDKMQCLLPDKKIQCVLDEYDGSACLLDFIKYQNNPPWSKMLLRIFVEQNNIFFEEVPNGNDVLFSLRVAVKSCKIAVISERLYYYMVNSNSIGTKKQSINEALCRITHLIKHNSFNKSIGHGDWNKSGLNLMKKLLLNGTILDRIFLVVLILVSIPKFVYVRNEWINALHTKSQ